MGRWMRRTALLLVMLAGSAVLAAPAQAGGPTSVLLSAPPKVVAAGYEDARYGELSALVEVGDPAAAAPKGYENWQFVRATWLIHDMQVWRLDIIFPKAPGGPWIATMEDQGLSGRLSYTPVWHRPADPAKLVKLLDAMGLLEGGQGGPNGLPQNGDATDGSGPSDTGTNGAGTSGTGTTEGADKTVAGAQDAAGTADTAGGGNGALTGWRWIIPGFLLGAVIAAVATRLWLPRRGRWELIDSD